MNISKSTAELLGQNSRICMFLSLLISLLKDRDGEQQVGYMMMVARVMLLVMRISVGDDIMLVIVVVRDASGCDGDGETGDCDIDDGCYGAEVMLVVKVVMVMEVLIMVNDVRF